MVCILMPAKEANRFIRVLIRRIGALYYVYVRCEHASYGELANGTSPAKGILAAMGMAVTVARRCSKFRQRKRSDDFWAHFHWLNRKVVARR